MPYTLCLLATCVTLEQTVPSPACLRYTRHLHACPLLGLPPQPFASTDPAMLPCPSSLRPTPSGICLDAIQVDCAPPHRVAHGGHQAEGMLDYANEISGHEPRKR